MNAEQYRRISEAFDELVILPATERTRLIQERFPDEAELRQYLGALLEEHDRNDAPVATARGFDAAGKSVAVPKCVPADRTLRFYRIDSFDDLEPGFKDILEPVDDSERLLHAKDMVGSV